MNDFFHNLASPGWWFGVVIVSFLINLAAAYAKPIIDRAFSKLSERRRHKLEKANLQAEQQILDIKHTPNGVVLLNLEELTLVLRCDLVHQLFHSDIGISCVTDSKPSRPQAANCTITSRSPLAHRCNLLYARGNQENLAC